MKGVFVCWAMRRCVRPEMQRCVPFFLRRRTIGSCLGVKGVFSAGGSVGGNAG